MRGQMEKVRVDKQRLIETLTGNRDEHRGQFLEAQKRYREKVIELLDQRLAEARQGGAINLAFGLPVPVDYTHEYEAAIQMLQWSLDEEVELDNNTFRQLVLNQWEWAQMFAGSTQVYLTD